jgi:hypothetical protein
VLLFMLLSLKLPFLCNICCNKHHLCTLYWMKPQSLSHTCFVSQGFLCEKNHILLHIHIYWDLDHRLARSKLHKLHHDQLNIMCKQPTNHRSAATEWISYGLIQKSADHLYAHISRTWFSSHFCEQLRWLSKMSTILNVDQID